MYFLYDSNNLLIFAGDKKTLLEFFGSKRMRKTRGVYCWQTRQIFQSMREAATALRVDHSQLSKHLRRVHGFKTVGGFTFSFSDTEEAQRAIKNNS